LTPEAAALMRHNLTLCANQQRDLAAKAKTDADAEVFRKGAETYTRLIDTLPRN
jgi:hypothetical protein